MRNFFAVFMETKRMRYIFGNNNAITACQNALFFSVSKTHSAGLNENAEIIANFSFRDIPWGIAVPICYTQNREWHTVPDSRYKVGLVWINMFFQGKFSFIAKIIHIIVEFLSVLSFFKMAQCLKLKYNLCKCKCQDAKIKNSCYGWLYADSGAFIQEVNYCPGRYEIKTVSSMGWDDSEI